MQLVVEANMSVADYAELEVHELKALLLGPRCCPHCGHCGCLAYLGFISATSFLAQFVFRSRFYACCVSKPVRL